MKINSHNEWDKILEIIVGSADGISATLEWISQDKLDEKKLIEAKNLAKEASPKWFIDEINEDLENLSQTLMSFNINVKRPKSYDISKVYSSPFWSSTRVNSPIASPMHTIFLL